MNHALELVPSDGVRCEVDEQGVESELTDRA